MFYILQYQISFYVYIIPYKQQNYHYKKRRY